MATPELRRARSMLNKISLESYSRHVALFTALIDECDASQYASIIDMIGRHAIQARGDYFAMFAMLIRDLTRITPVFQDAVTSRVDYELRLGLESSDKHRFLGIVDLIAHMTRNGALQPQKLRSFLDSAFAHATPVAIEAIYRVLLVIKSMYAKLFTPSFERLSSVWSSRLPNRLRFLIIDLIELRERSWVPRHLPDPPMMPLSQFRQHIRQANT